MLKVRKFYQPIASCFSTARKKRVGGTLNRAKSSTIHIPNEFLKLNGLTFNF